MLSDTTWLKLEIYIKCYVNIHTVLIGTFKWASYSFHMGVQTFNNG